MIEFIVCSTLALTACLAIVSFARSRVAIRKGAELKSASRRFALVASAAGLFAGIPFYYGILWALECIGLRVYVGHGEVLIATPILNAVLGFFLAAVGWSILRWAPLRW